MSYPVATAVSASSRAFREVMPAAIARLRNFWNSLSSSTKTAVVAAAAGSLGMTVGQSDDLGPVMAEASTRSISQNVDMMAAILNAVPAEVSRDMIASMQQHGRDGGAVVTAVEAARSRASSTLATGDGKAIADPQAAAYDAIVARLRMLRRALAAIGSTNPSDLRALRDVMFMDEQEFEAAIARL